MSVKLLTEYHLEFLSLKGGCRSSSESAHVKMPHCWESHALTHMLSHDLAYTRKVNICHLRACYDAKPRVVNLGTTTKLC